DTPRERTARARPDLRGRRGDSRRRREPEDRVRVVRELRRHAGRHARRRDAHAAALDEGVVRALCGVTVPTEDEVLGYFDSLSNWGRWGADDELGTLNLVTPEQRIAAAELVRTV